MLWSSSQLPTHYRGLQLVFKKNLLDWIVTGVDPEFFISVAQTPYGA